MSEILIESMTRYVFRPSPGKFYMIRMWRQETVYVNGDSELVRNEAIKLLAVAYGANYNIPKPPHDKSSIAQLLIGMEKMNAVEVLDEDGDGVVVYKDWP